MRQALLSLLLVSLVSTLRAQQPSHLDVPAQGELRIDDPRNLEPCYAGTAVAQIARILRVPIGFENMRDCWLTPRGPAAETGSKVLTGMSARQALDHLMTLMPTYAWREVGGVAVVRPKDAWDDPTNVLNRPTKPFEATNALLDEVLSTVLRGTTPVGFLPHERMGRERPMPPPVTMVFRGGTMLEALNAVVRAHHDVEWQLGYGSGRATLVLSALDLEGWVVMAPVAIPQSP